MHMTRSVVGHVVRAVEGKRGVREGKRRGLADQSVSAIRVNDMHCSSVLNVILNFVFTKIYTCMCEPLYICIFQHTTHTCVPYIIGVHANIERREISYPAPLPPPLLLLLRLLLLHRHVMYDCSRLTLSLSRARALSLSLSLPPSLAPSLSLTHWCALAVYRDCVQKGDTALMLASWNGQAWSVGQLLDKGADVNAQNGVGG